MNKVIALDLGKVCVNIIPEACPETLDISSRKMEEYMSLYLAHETGKMNGNDFIEKLGKLSAKKLTLGKISAAFCSIIGEEIPGISDIIHTLVSRGYRICLLSDTSEIHLCECLRKLSFSYLITGGVYSFETGALKPDKKMFLEFEKRYGKPALYIDDKEINCKGAEKYGWRAHCFYSVEALQTRITVL